MKLFEFINYQVLCLVMLDPLGLFMNGLLALMIFQVLKYLLLDGSRNDDHVKTFGFGAAIIMAVKIVTQLVDL